MRSAGFWELCCYLLRRRERFRVDGASMSPALRAGDQVFVARRRAPRRGDVVVARHPYRSDVHVVKRLVELDGTGGCELRGDNPAESSDSRVFGKVRSELIVGPVTSRV